MVEYADGTYGIIDFKTSSSTGASTLYSRQLHAYATAIENPTTDSPLKKARISELGLVIYSPSEFHTPVDSKGRVQAAMTGDLKYVKVERDDAGFLQFLGEVLDVLNMPEAPPFSSRIRSSAPTCPYCKYLHQARDSGLLLKM